MFLAGAFCALSVSSAIVYLHDQNLKAERDKAAVLAAKVQRLQDQNDWDRYDAQIAACERGNALRLKLDDLAQAEKALNSLLVQFFDSSVRLRKKAGLPGLAKEAIKARETIRKVARKVKNFPPVDCRSVIVPPIHPRPFLKQRSEGK